MAIRCTTIPIILLHFLTHLLSTHCHATTHTYIIHVSKPHKPAIFPTMRHWYTSSILPTSTALLYTYNHALHGFAARLTPDEASRLRTLPFILAVHLDHVAHLHTTRSPHFLNLNNFAGLWPTANFADDIIVGVLDTGIWPDGRRSFTGDQISGAAPARWKGSCVDTKDFNSTSMCNNKIIGAKFFSIGYEAEYGPIDETNEYRSPRDSEGHGTHTASTVAGALVKNASFYEYGIGDARGVATKARLAVYKICWSEGCVVSDILAAMDEAVSDGVDVISVSVGISNGLNYDEDAFAVGAFGAVEKGVIVVCSAGNSGPKESTLENIAPWILTVGASSMDRDFPADVFLGDGRVYRGVSLYAGEKLTNQSLPLVYAGDHGHRLCVPGVLKNVEGKIVLCDGGINGNVAKGNAVKLGGGVGMILASDVVSGPGGPADQHVIPATMVDPTSGKEIKDYIKSQPFANATIIFRGTVIGPNPPAPQVARFSSRGPNDVTPEIIKPDVIAPGVNILASWTGGKSPSELDTDPRRVEFNFQYGTSMACPHVSGITALLRKVHPTWSPAAIKSAIMTTAYNVDNAGRSIIDFATGKESTPFDLGSGHINPNKASDPGFVYDLDVNDYIGFLCSIGYDASRIAVIVRDRTVDCSKMGFTSPSNLNYPSFSVVFKSKDEEIVVKRVVKNVGHSFDAIYKVKVSGPPSVEIVVSPSQLVFSQQNQRLSYEVKFSSLADRMVDGSPKFGSIEWSDGTHVVRSPIAFTWNDELISSI
ncbi:hypothetical protein Sjap_011915 [Stephania japonica]|uniref:Uncharacterized protein n=1 Tax=Stephania japonica TaxID=461633 RepID=A0AAP0JCE6_9MAGN